MMTTESKQSAAAPSPVAQDEREAFEKWILTFENSADFERDEFGYYLEWDVQRAWVGWTAAIAQQDKQDAFAGRITGVEFAGDCHYFVTVEVRASLPKELRTINGNATIAAMQAQGAKG